MTDTPLIHFDRPLVVRIRDKAAPSKGRRFGIYLKAALSVIFGWGAERGYLADNPDPTSKRFAGRGDPDAKRPGDRSHQAGRRPGQ